MPINTPNSYVRKVSLLFLRYTVVYGLQAARLWDDSSSALLLLAGLALHG